MLKYDKNLVRIFIDTCFKQDAPALAAQLLKEFPYIEDLKKSQHVSQMDGKISVFFVGADYHLAQLANNGALDLIFSLGENISVDGNQILQIDDQTKLEDIIKIIAFQMSVLDDQTYLKVRATSLDNLQNIISKSDGLLAGRLTDIDGAQNKWIKLEPNWEKSCEVILEFGENILNARDLKQSHAFLLEVIKKMFNWKITSIHPHDNLYAAFASATEHFIPLKSTGDRYDFLAVGKAFLEVSISDACFFLQIYNIFEIHVDRLRELNRIIPEESIWDEAFSQISMPVALMSASGELLQHNYHFSKLNVAPATCLQLDNGDKHILDNTSYKIFRSDLYYDGQNLVFVAFATTEISIKNSGSSSSELGIITSSIAHELNNPLAGIFVALGVLELDDEWSAEDEFSISEMKKGVRRCKDLVETFLGFSKMHPSQASGESKDGLVVVALEQAFNLIRFRLIESNIKLDFKQKQMEEVANLHVNISVFSMVTYLILGELLTAYSHYLLISINPEKHDKKLLKGIILGSMQGITIEIDGSFDFKDQILSAKLIKHLLDIENMDMMILDNRIIIEKREETDD